MNFSQRILAFRIFILFCGLNCEAVRVKHSKYEPDSPVPDDDNADWPSPDQLYFGLGAKLEGIIIVANNCSFQNITKYFRNRESISFLSSQWAKA